jgi:glucose-6-phosphate dehydrogenase assembly protein OpcA
LEAAVIIDLPSSTVSQVNKKLVELRETGGAVALGRVLTLVMVTGDGTETEPAIQAANDASREHPARSSSWRAAPGKRRRDSTRRSASAEMRARPR